MPTWNLILLLSISTLGFILRKADCIEKAGKLKTKDCKCGVMVHDSARIYGGTASPVIPWQVGILYSDHFQCGGSLINDRYILSAAHCFKYFNDQKNETVICEREKFKYLLGTNTLMTWFDTRSAKSLVLHELYNAETLNFDIAVSELDIPIKEFTINLSPICLPPLNHSFVNFKAVVSGWGESETSNIVDRLLVAIIDILPSNRCSKYENFNRKYSICGASRGKDACRGDSGGPLVTKFLKKQYSQIGIVSAGFAECSHFEHPGVYTRINAFGDWIISNTIDGYYCNK